MAFLPNVQASRIIGSLTGITSISATTISGGTLYGNGANLTGIPTWWTTGSTTNYSIKTVNNTNVISTGYYSLAGGDRAVATGDYSFSYGIVTSATTNSSIAMGNSTLASGIGAVALGVGNKATALYSFATGLYSQANGVASFVYGSGSTANGNSTIVLGKGITGNSNDTTYVDNLNIRTVGGGTAINNLGIDSSGNVVVGSAGGGSSATTLSNISYIDFNTTASTSHSEGRIHWNDTIKSLEIDTENANVQIQVGHQNVARVNNQTGSILTKGTVVYINGEQGQRPTVTKADYSSEPTSASVIGIVMADISNNSNGYVITSGILEGINTIAYSAGTPLYLYTGGTFTSTKAQAPLHDVRLGKIVVSNATTGSIYVSIQNGYELEELHDIRITNASSNDVLVRSTYNGSNVWVNTKTLSGLTSVSSTDFSGTTMYANQFQTSTYSAATSANTFTFNCNNGMTQALDMQGSTSATTISITNQKEGSTYILMITQGSSLYNIVFPSGWWMNDEAFDFTSLANDIKAMVTMTYLNGTWFFAAKKLTQV